MSAAQPSAPLLVTERLELWQPCASDLPDLLALIEDEETRRFLGGRPASMQDVFERLHRNAGSWALHGYGTFLVRARGEGRIIGNCGVFRSWRGITGLDDVPEAGWIVHRDWWGKGVAGEVMRAVLAWFDQTHGSQRIGCMIEEGNAASERLAAALGFVEYGRHQPDGEARALVLYERG